MRVFALQNMPPINLRLVHSHKKARKLMSSIGVSCDYDESAEAVTLVLDTDAGLTSLVIMNSNGAGTQDIALLVHESIHVAQAYWESIGEDKPSEEFMAYTVQSISQYLIDEHKAWRKRKGLR